MNEAMESQDLPRKQQCVGDIQLRKGVFEAPFYCLMVGENNSPYPVFLGFLCDSAGKESACNAGDLGSFPGLGRSPGDGNGYPLQYSGLENSKNCIVHEGHKESTRLSDFHFHFLSSHIHQS